MIDNCSRDYWCAVLQACHSNVSRAAVIADVDRTTVYKYVKRYGLTMDVRPNRFQKKRYWFDPPRQADEKSGVISCR